MPLGNPIRKQNESRIISVLATEGQSVFTVEGGYIINHISVFRNGVRLSNSEDFTAGDGSTVTLNDEANVDDRIEFHVFDRFTVNNAIVGAASSQTISGDLVVNGKLFGNLDVPSINTGIVTATELDLNGKGDISGDLRVTGISTFINVDAAGIVTARQGLRINAGGLNVSGIITAQNGINFNGTSTGLNVASGISTFQAITGTTGLFSDTISITDNINHIGDIDTAIRFPAADTFTVETAGSEKLRVASDGDLTLTGADNVEMKMKCGTSSGNNIIAFLNSGGTTRGNITYDSDDNFLLFNVNQGEKLRITSGGNVNIGGNYTQTTYPFQLTGSGSGDAASMVIKNEGSDPAKLHLMSGHGNWSVSNSTTVSDAFEVRDESASSTRVIISSSGDLGIGNVTSPDDKVEIRTFSNDMGVLIKSTGSTSNAIKFDANRSGANQGIGNIKGRWNGTTVAQMYMNTGDDTTDKNDGYIIFGTESAASNGNVNATERLRITSDGQIGLNNTSPDAWYSTYRSIQIYDGAVLYGSADDSFVGLGANHFLNTSGDFKYSNTDFASRFYQVNGEFNFESASSGTAGDTFSFTEKLRITTDGDLSLRSTTQNANVGLKANSTAINLNLGSTAGASPRMYFFGTGNGQSTAGDIFMGAGNGGILHFRSAESIKFEVNSDSSTAEALRINSAGSMGLGTGANIDEKVHFENAGNISLLVECSTSGSGSNSALRLKSADSSSDWYMQTGNATTGGLRFYAGSERMRITPEGYVTKPYHPCFRAGNSAAQTPGSSGTIVFNYLTAPTHFNQGGHYDSSTGAFTAPVAGVYSFHCQVLFQGLANGQDMADAIYFYYNSSGGASGGVSLSYDQRRAEYIDNETGQGGYFSAHSTVIVDMAANSSVYVRNNRNLTIHGNANYTFFQGYLIG